MSILRHNLLSLLFILCSLFLWSCGQGNKQAASPADSLPQVSRDSLPGDSLLSKTELSALYVQAISDFLTAVTEKEQHPLDTLFLAKRQNLGADDFPDIDLPAQVDGCGLRLLDYAEAHLDQKGNFSERTPFINLMGWADRQQAEFMFVCFYPEFEHRYDAQLFYHFDSSTQLYQLDDCTIQVLERNEQQQATHYSIYRHGKLVGTRGINVKRQ